MNLHGALAHYGKRWGMAIVERDGTSFEVVLSELPEPAPDYVANIRRLFEHLPLRSVSVPSLFPML